MRCFVVAGFLLTSASRGPSAIVEPLVMINSSNDVFSQRLVPYGVSLIYGFYPYKVIKGCNIEAPKGKEGF